MEARTTLRVADESYEIFRLDALQEQWDVERLPYTLRVLLENVLRAGSDADAEAVAGWVAAEEPSREISFRPSRVLHQDFTGVPAIVDLAAMRDAMQDLGDSGLIRAASPPSSSIASRMAARSTIAGTPVKSCISTRAGV